MDPATIYKNIFAKLLFQSFNVHLKTRQISCHVPTIGWDGLNLTSCNLYTLSLQWTGALWNLIGIVIRTAYPGSAGRWDQNGPVILEFGDFGHVFVR